VDREVAEWVIQALEKRRLGRLAKSEKPALHAAPLDAMVSPAAEKVLDRNVEESHVEEANHAIEDPNLADEDSKPADEEPKPADDEPASDSTPTAVA